MAKVAVWFWGVVARVGHVQPCLLRRDKQRYGMASHR